MIGGRTRVFALLGDPVAHSLSPAMHNAAFQAVGLDAVYVALRVDAGGLETVMLALAKAGGGGNVTIPHKRAAAAYLGMGISASCNVFWGNGGRLHGASTDQAGVMAGWAELGRPAGAWLVLGTGGSAYAAVGAATSVGAPFAVRSRSAARRREFEQAAVAAGGRLVTGDEAGLVVNCTPLGWAPSDPFPLPALDVPAGASVLDLVYAKGGSRWVRALRSAGVPARDGRTVLLEQGAAAFELWFPGEAAPREVMRAAVEQALR